MTYAAPAGQPTPPNAPIQVTFNRPMNRASVENAFLVTPAVAGAFEWAPDSRSFLYRHEAPLDTATNYTVRILGTAQDDTGAGLDGNFNRLREGSPADDFVWTFRFRVSNDDFTAAQPLSGTTGSIRGNNQYSWVELNEPPHVLGDYVHFADSAWYRWTAPVQVGWFTFDLTAGTGFDSLLAVYTGDQLDRLIPVAGNDNYGSRPGSRVTFASNGGTSYSLVVATRALFNIAYGAGQNGGAFTLNWYPTPSPAFTGAQFSPSSGMPGSKVTLTGTDFTGATAVLFNGASASFANAPTNNLDLRISAIVPSDATSGPITVMTPHGNVTSTATFQVLPPRLLIARTDLGRFEIRWSATSDAFVLEASDNLASGKWTIVDKLPIHESGFSKIPMTPKAVHFYRLSTR